jgi:hypothetical protein
MGVRQPLQYKQAQKACRAVNGELLTLHDTSSKYLVTQALLLSVVANVTHVTTLQEAYGKVQLQMPSSSWQMMPYCSSSSSSNAATSDSWGSFWSTQQQQQQQQDADAAPAAPLLWWVDAPYAEHQQQQQRSWHSSSSCSALGAVERGVVTGVACRKRLPYICTGEAGAHQL